MKKQCNCKNCDCHKDYSSGTKQVQGTYSCKNCGQKVYLDCDRALPNCPKCGANIFTKE